MNADRASQPLTYAVVSPVRDESAFLKLAARSLIEQSVRPREWVIVDDGSNDQTGAIADGLAAEHEWITAVHRPRRSTRERGAPIVRAFKDGLSRLDSRDDVVVKLDGDIQLPSHYFEWVLDVFEREPRAGIVGGTVYVNDGKRWVPDAVGRRTVHGAIKAYRRDCFDDIGGLHEAMGWDGIDEYAARSRGWRVLPLTELTVLHYKPRGSKQRWTRARWEEGRGARYMGYNGQGIAIRTAYRCIREQPPLLSGLVLLGGYVWSTLTRGQRCPDEQAIRLLREEQSERFRGLLRLDGDLEPDRPRDGGPAFWALDREPQT
ncbi:MAG TPA: glycosyltransferase [Solirubrobacteraceae bacterium]|jgi:glycosyltransferase involved in cell wall biosynthesis|nr:glycosyltransferase [Solirubrobacteraceae bacterium]